MDFTCNICDTRNTGVERLGREVESCRGCRSSVRIRALMLALSRELFGAPLSLSEFPAVKSLRGLGLSDSESYAKTLADRFYYRNTYFDRDPQFDITSPDPRDLGTLDFLLASEVFEHVNPPVESAFRNALSLLAADGVFVMTVPYKPAGATEEHFPDLFDAGLATLRSGRVLVNRTEDGTYHVHDGLSFHGGSGSTLEMRVFSENGLRQILSDAGFQYVRIHSDDFPEFGVVHEESWSLPLSARRAAPAGNRAALTELSERYRKESQDRRAWEARVRALDADLEESRNWVARLQADLAESNRNVRFEQEQTSQISNALDEQTARTNQIEAELRKVHDELQQRTVWALSLESDVEARTKWAQDLESQLNERTEWALQLDQRSKSLEAELQKARSAIWYRLGRRLRLI